MVGEIGIFISLLLVPPPVSGWPADLTLVDIIHHKNLTTWSEAQSICRRNHADLLSVRGDLEREFSVRGGGWIGLSRKDNTSPWKWSRGDEIANFTSWEHDYPRKDSDCAWKEFKTDKWRDDRCHIPHSFVCHNTTLVLVKENKTWEEALEHCRSLQAVQLEQSSVLGKNFYDLATLTTADDHHYARGRAQQAATEEVWTGLRFLGDAWFWVGGEQVQYSELPSCPALRCGVLEKNSQASFGLRDCSERRNFFCYRRAGNMGTE